MRLPRLDDLTSCWKRSQNVYRSNPNFVNAVIVSSAIAILGGLALAGVFYPISPFRFFGKHIGKIGGSLLLGSGLTATVMLLFSGIFFGQEPNTLSKMDKIPSGKGVQPEGTPQPNTGAAYRDTRYDNVEFA